MLSTLQYITSDHAQYSHFELGKQAFQAGCKWVQLRMKDAADQYILDTALALKEVAKACGGMLTINDNVLITKKTNTNGVHLGVNDTPVKEAKTILNAEQIIGKTANSIQELTIALSEGVDYIGYGPLRFTSTKKNLSTPVGIQAYKALKNPTTPIYAIGGIRVEDLSELSKTHVHGIAISSLLTNSSQKEQLISQIHRIFDARD